MDAGIGAPEQNRQGSPDTPLRKDAAPDARKPREGVPGRPPCRKVTELIRRAYDPGTKRRLGLGKGELAAVAENPGLNDLDREQILLLAQEDTTLEKSRELLLFVEENAGLRDAATTIRNFVREVLRGHPAFRGEALSACLSSPGPELRLEEDARSVHAQLLKALLRGEGTKPLPKKQRQRCHEAAFHCVLLLWREAHELSLGEIQRLLLATSWAGFVARRKSDEKSLRSILLSRDPEATALAAALLQEEVHNWSRRTELARADASELRERLSALKQHLTGVEAELETERQRRAETTGTLEAERRSWANERSHRIDAFESLKGRVLHRMNSEVGLLAEGLQALRRTPPKVHVMDDHAERAIDALKREIDSLRRETE